MDAWDPTTLLRSIGLFEDLDDESILWLAERSRVTHVGGGEAVVRQGEMTDGLYVVHLGWLRVTVEDRDGSERLVDHTGPGGLVGEMAMISDEPRSTTVTAVRDSELVYLPTRVFDELVSLRPALLRRVTAQVVARRRRSLEGQPPRAPRSVFALVAISADSPTRRAARALATALTAGDGRALIVDRDLAVSEVGSDVVARPDDHRRELAAWRERLEAQRPRVVFACDASDDHWTRWCARQSDLVIMVATAGRPPPLSPLDQVITDDRRTSHRRVELVLVHPAQIEDPAGTSRWREQRAVDAHHHLRDGDDQDISRVVRLLANEATTLVLSGGGARGIAHIGVVRAAQELGVPIDAVGGTSIGALIAAVVARGWTWPRIVEDVRAGLATGKGIIDPTVPLVSLASGRRVTERLRHASAGLDLEDLLLDYFCVSTNLSTRSPKVHDRGTSWWAVRASLAIPGLFPPVPDGDDVLVDGGLLDNYPVAAMRRRHPGSTVIGVDVGSRRVLSAGSLSVTCEAPARGSLRAWWNLRGRDRSVTLPKLLAALTELGQEPSDETGEADVTVRPAVDAIAILGFDRFDELVALGYRAGLEALQHGIDDGRVTASRSR